MKPCMAWFDPKKHDDMWRRIADVQERERHDDTRKAQKEQEKAAAASSGGFGVKHRLSPGEVWRATDFWREALLNNTRDDIKKYNKDQKLSIPRESVLFIGTQFSILYTSMYSPAEAATPRA